MDLKINHEELESENISYKPRDYMRVIIDQQNEFGVVIYHEQVMAYGPLGQLFVFIADQMSGGIETADLSVFIDPPECTVENLKNIAGIY